jgi:cysteine-rich repeat protein
VDSALWSSAVPSVKDGSVVEYQLVFSFTDGSTKTFPENPADAFYEFYVGEVVPLYCTNFDTDPFAEGWTHGLVFGEASDGADDWAWGTPGSPIAAGDPTTAYTGDAILGNDLGGGDFNGLYQSDKKNYARAPLIEAGQYSDIHLQYFRWLSVEDGFFDQANIVVNNKVAWQNLNSDRGNSSAIHHQDREWHFHDVALSPFVKTHQIDFQFEIESDSGLEFGGWNIDDVCVVALASSICGDGVITGAEECDDADKNDDEKVDACRTSCFAAYCGDGVLDSEEECDDGNEQDGDRCNRRCEVPNGGCGCHSTEPGDALVLLFALYFAVARKRRRWSKNC